jgi:hypothetical protein
LLYARSRGDFPKNRAAASLLLSRRSEKDILLLRALSAPGYWGNSHIHILNALLSNLRRKDLIGNRDKSPCGIGPVIAVK